MTGCSYFNSGGKGRESKQARKREGKKERKKERREKEREKRKEESKRGEKENRKRKNRGSIVKFSFLFPCHLSTFFKKKGPKNSLFLFEKIKPLLKGKRKEKRN